MKKFILLTVVITAILVGCGSGSSKSKNQYLGTIPAIHAEYKAKKEALKEKKTKLKTPKEFTKWQEDSKANETNAIEKLLAEAEIIANKPIPVSFSKALVESGKLFFNVESAMIPPIKKKINMDNDGISIKMNITSKEDFVIPPRKGSDYYMYYRFVTSDGSTIQKKSTMPLNVFIESSSKSFQYKVGDTLIEEHAYLFIEKTPELYADFAGIEFISKEEFDNIPN